MVKSDYEKKSRQDRCSETKTVIARLKAVRGMSEAEIANRLALKAETLRKYAGGYQPASPHVFQLLLELGEGANSETPRPSTPASGMFSLPARLERILRVATTAQVEAVRGVIELLESTLRPATEPLVEQPVVLSDDFELVPMEYAPAGLPSEGGLIRGERVAVPRSKMKHVDSAIRVHGDSMIDAGISHGDIVLLSRKREPRRGDIVAARFDDNDVTLKRYDVVKGRPVLRAENKAFQIPIEPVDSMQILGVVVGKL